MGGTIYRLFDREWHPEGGDSHPPPGRDFVLALGDSFAKAGVAFSMAGGFSSLFRSRQSALKVPVSLQQRAESIIHSLAGCNDFRWMTEDDAQQLW